MEMENGPEVVIFLAQNPEICEELTQMSPSRAVAEVWRISEKLSPATKMKKSKKKSRKRLRKRKLWKRSQNLGQFVLFRVEPVDQQFRWTRLTIKRIRNLGRKGACNRSKQSNRWAGTPKNCRFRSGNHREASSRFVTSCFGNGKRSKDVSNF